MGWWAGEPLCQGDQGADIIDVALKKLNKVWAESWGRRIKKEEVEALVDFCMPEELDEKGSADGRLLHPQ